MNHSTAGKTGNRGVIDALIRLLLRIEIWYIAKALRLGVEDVCRSRVGDSTVVETVSLCWARTLICLTWRLEEEERLFVTGMQCRSNPPPRAIVAGIAAPAAGILR